MGEVLGGGTWPSERLVGEMATRLRAHDWARTSLGPLGAWPCALRTATSIVLGSRAPMALWWGEDLVGVYNDAFASILGARHPSALGRPAREVWRDEWDVLGPQVEGALGEGRSTWTDELALVLARDGSPREEMYLTLACTPLPADDGAVGGVLCVCTDETRRVLARRRLETARALATRTAAEAKTDQEACDVAADVLGANPKDLPFALVYLVDETGEEAKLRASTGLRPGLPASPVDVPVDPGGPWPLWAHGGEPRVIDDLERRFGEIRIAPWPDLVERAVILPLSRDDPGASPGYLVAGISPRLPYDDVYAEFLRSLATELGTTLVNLRPQTGATRGSPPEPDHVVEPAPRVAPLDTSSGEVVVPDELGHPITDRESAEARDRFLVTLDDALRATTDPVAGIRAATTLLGEHLGATRCGYADADPDGEHVVVPYEHFPTGADPSFVGRWSLSSFGRHLATELRSGRACVVRDVARELGGDSARFLSFGVRAVVWAPAIRGGRAVAFTFVHADAPRRWTREEMELVELVAGRCWEWVERARVVRDLEDSERRFRALVSVITDVPWTTDATGAFAVPQRAWEAYTGQGWEQHRGFGWLLALHPDDRAPIEASWHRAWSSREPYEATNRLWHARTGQYRHVVARATPVFEADGTIRERVGTCTDVHERTLAEAAARATRRQLLAALYGAKMVAWEWDFATGRCDRYGPVHELLGITGDRVETYFASVHPDDRPRVEALASRAARGEVPYAEEFRFVRPDGSVRWLRDVADLVRDERGEPVGMSGVCADVTARRQSEDALRAAEERLRLITASVKDHAIITLDPQGRITGWNTGAERMFGWAASEAIGEPAELVFTPEDREAGRAQLELGLAADRGLADDEREHVRKDGTRFWASGGMEGLFDDAGRLRGFVKVVRDVTDRRAVELERERLLASERSARTEAERVGRMKDEFLATLSHELRTPLNAILGWAQILARKAPDDEDLRQGIDTIHRNARAQAQLIDDLLDTSLIVSGRVTLETASVDLSSIVAATVEVARPWANAKGVRLVSTLDPDAGLVRADASRLRQVFWNLLHNAVKFTPAGGEVHVTLDRTGERAEVAVRDTGQGFDPEFLPHIFERFRQADSSTTRQHGGLGLGLSIVEHLVELHGGQVRAESPGVGRGATFTVALPIAGALSAGGNGHDTTRRRETGDRAARFKRGRASPVPPAPPPPEPRPGSAPRRRRR